MIRGIHHVAVHVRDIDRMIKFYDEAFGFKQIGGRTVWETDNTVIAEIIDVPKSSAACVMLRAGNCYLELFQYITPAPKSVTPLNPYDRGYTHFCVDVTDVATEVERLRKVGMTFDRPHGKGKPVDAGICKTIYGRDPEGNLIEIQETLTDCEFPADKLRKLAAAE
jgi:catechol 2,3-dioxygenase-like lactoylglutathione lyase family enzyme